jgi:enoyl-CoA hydratase
MIGEVLLNKEHKNNILSENFMDDIRRSLEAMEIDEATRVITLSSKNHQVFSLGTDLYYLYHKKKNGEIDKINNYFEHLYNFQNFIANYHKPLLAVGSGVLSIIK